MESATSVSRNQLAMRRNKLGFGGLTWVVRETTD
jgi:hypothetical protein